MTRPIWVTCPDCEKQYNDSDHWGCPVCAMKEGKEKLKEANIHRKLNDISVKLDKLLDMKPKPEYPKDIRFVFTVGRTRTVSSPDDRAYHYESAKDSLRDCEFQVYTSKTEELKEEKS